MPTPKKDEKESDYMNRCVPMLIKEGKKPDQAVAICNSMFTNSKKKAEGEQWEF